MSNPSPCRPWPKADTSEAGEIEQQAKHARLPEAGANLLKANDNDNDSAPKMAK